MANSDKNILITPNIGSTSKPTIVVTGANNVPGTITVEDSGSLSFDTSLDVSGSITVSGTSSLADLQITGQVYSGGVVDDGTFSGSNTINFTTGNFHKGTLSDHCTMSFINTSGPSSYFLAVSQSGGPWTITWPEINGGDPAVADTGTTIVALYWDGITLHGPTDPTPELITEAEIDAGTGSLERVVSAARLKYAVEAYCEYMVPIWAEESGDLASSTYEWAFGNGADTPSNAGITIYVPTGWSAEIVAMTATTNNASGTSVIEANINGTLQGSACNVTISGRSGVNDSFTPVSLSSGDRLTFRTTTAGTNTLPSTVTAWLRYYR